MEVKGVIADSPCYCALFTRSRCLVGLTLDAEIHNVVTADGAVVDDNVPGPKSYSVPLLDFESLLALVGTRFGGLGLHRRICHIHVRHGLSWDSWKSRMLFEGSGVEARVRLWGRREWRGV